MVVVSKALVDQSVSLGASPERVLFYPNGIDPIVFDPDRFSDVDRHATRRELGIPDGAELLTFVGTFGLWHGTDVLAEAIRRLIDEERAWLEKRGVHFLYVGDGALAPKVRSILGPGHGAPFVTLAGFRPQTEAPRILAASDILLSPHVPNPDGTPFFGSPTKLFEYMAMAKPIVASDLDQVGWVLKGWRAGEPPPSVDTPRASKAALLVEPGSVEDLVRGIRQAVELPRPERDALGREARRLVLAVLHVGHERGCHARAVARGEHVRARQSRRGPCVRITVRAKESGVLQVAMSGGEVRVVEVPEPVVRRGAVLVRTSHSLISAGTESAGIGSGGRRENLVLRAIRNPALVKKVMDRVASHGLASTAELVRTRISTEMPSGYSCAGVVVDVGEDVTDIRKGDRVACAGAGYANHAGVNVVPRNLVALVPDGVSFEEAAFGTLGAIALQGVRRAEPGLGDRVAVLGLGLLGQITAQMLKASGAVVIGVDVRPERVARAQALGLDAGFTISERDFVAGVLERTGGRGADAVIVTAAGGDAGLLNKAFEACRRKGRVVLVGDVPIRIQRDKIYKKEIDFLISTSYGPGRYDPSYEEKGQDYPFGYVRWTEGRNLEDVLRQIASGALRVRPLIDATHGVEDASAAYASLASENRPIGILLDYHVDAAVEAAARGHVPPDTARGGAPEGRHVRRRSRRLRRLLPLDAAAAPEGPPRLLAGRGLCPQRPHASAPPSRTTGSGRGSPTTASSSRTLPSTSSTWPRGTTCTTPSHAPRSKPARPSSSRSR